MSSDYFLTVEEVVARYRDQISEGTLRNWRSYKRGPPFVKVGKAVLYPLADLRAWEAKQTVACVTSVEGTPSSASMPAASRTARE